MTPAVDSRKRSSFDLSGGHTSINSQVRRRLSSDAPAQGDTFHAVLAAAACSLGATGPPVLSSDHRNVVQHLERRLKSNEGLKARFLECFQAFIADETNLRRLLLPLVSTARNGGVRHCDTTLAKVLLSMGETQSPVATSLLEKLPEYVGEVDGDSPVPLPPLMESIPRLILSQFRWLEFLVDSGTLTEKIMEVLSICPLGLKKEIITFLPEVIVDADHEMVVQSLEIMLQDDLQLIVPVLDAFSNLNLEDCLFQQVVALALSSLRSADVEDLPLVVKFLLQSATRANVKQVVQQLRENLHFMAVADVRATKPDRKMKGKSTATNCEALVLEAIRSGLRFQNLLLEASLKEIRGVEGEKNHKVVDIWLLLIIHANGAPHRKTAEQLLLKKIIRGDVGELLLRQCIQGRGNSLQDYFQTLVSVSESCLRSKELALRQFGKSAYQLLFQEFVDPYYRQEVLGALISHTGSGNSHEIGSALETLLLFATEHVHDLLPISSFINGVLDHLEGFQDNHLHQVYQIFSELAVTASCSGGLSSGSSIGSELLIVVRKQISSSVSKFRRMGIIGAIRLASCLNKGRGDVQHDNMQGSDTKEIHSILQMTLDACESSPTSRGFFYDELASQVETAAIGTPFHDWISKHVNESEFATSFLCDLGREGFRNSDEFEVAEWMYLDSEECPVVLNMLPMLMKDDHSSSQALMYLPANFALLARVEGAVHEGSLAEIDVLLGCPILLPEHQFLTGESWKKLSNNLRRLACYALFYTINWIRELINAFSSQNHRRKTIAKLFKRVRNLMFLEKCLGHCLESTKISFEPLHSMSDGPTQLRSEPKLHIVGQDVSKSRAGKREKKASSKKKGRTDANGSKKAAGANSQAPSANGQPTIIDALNKSKRAGGVEASTPQGEDPPQSVCGATQTTEEREANAEGLEEQRWKFRPLTLSSLKILSASQAENLSTHIFSVMQTTRGSCCLDPHAELPIILLLLEDLKLKLDWCLETPSRKLAPWMNAPALPKAPSGLGGMSGIAALRHLAPLFPSLRKHLDCSIAILQSDGSQSQQVSEERTCDNHWVEESIAARNPPDETFTVSTTKTAESLFLVMIRCFSKILSYPELTMPAHSPLLKAFLLAFGNGESKGPDLIPPSAQCLLEEAFSNVYNYFDDLSEAAAAVSFTTATELVMVLQALVNCAQTFTNKSKDDPRRRRSSSDRSVGVVPRLRSRLSFSAERVLRYDWSADDWKNKGDTLQQLLRIQIQNNDSPGELLEELVSSVMPQLPSKGAVHGSVSGYPALSSGTFMVWYRVEHEQVLDLLSKLVKDCLAQSQSKTLVPDDLVVNLLTRAQQCVTLHVSLANLTKKHDKTPIHAMAVKSGGKFVDTFLKGFDFLKSHYDAHKESIDALVLKLQKATRIVQTLCAEAKGQKRMPVTCKVPVVKRSMERYVYCIKALLHCTAHGSSFWMGNLKHKDLHGREIGSQPYADEDEKVEVPASDNEEEPDDDAAAEMEE